MHKVKVIVLLVVVAGIQASHWIQVESLQAECNRLLNDKTSLHSQITELREHYASLGMAPTLATGHMASVRASLEAESAKAEAVRHLQAAQLDHATAVKQWDQERHQLQVVANTITGLLAFVRECCYDILYMTCSMLYSTT